MTESDGGELHWRETFFVWFRPQKRPKLSEVEKLLRGLRDHFELRNAEADEEGRFESVTVLSPADHAALEITYLVGDDIREEAERLAAEIEPDEVSDPKKLALLPKCSARFDVMHFEQRDEQFEEEEDFEDLLDPSALLVVVEALARLTDGVGVDPQSGMLL